MNDALYTKYFKDWYSSTVTEQSSTTWLQNLLSDLADITSSEIAPKLVQMLRAKYDYHEICDEDSQIFFNLLINKIITYKDYYMELLAAYNTQINFLDGKKTVVTREDDSNGSGSSSGSNSSTGKGYELPNKTINDGLGNLSNANTSTGENENESSYEDHSEGTLTTIGDVDVVDAKRRYLDLIRNLYSEWADKVYDCFIGLYN